MNQQKVLIIDGNESQKNFLIEILQNEPIQLLTAADGQSGLVKLVNETPDLILMDEETALIDGYRLCHYFKNHLDYRMIPLILLTADPDKLEIRLAAFDTGVDDVIHKPLDEREALSRIRSHLKVRRFSRESEQLTQERLRFMAGIAHNIRSPLNALMLNLEITEAFAPAGSKLHKYHKRMEMSLKQIEKMTQDMMSFYKAGLGQNPENLGWYELQELLDEIMIIVKPNVSKRDLDLDVNELSGHKIFTDKNILQQVLLNILENAIKYTDSGGSIQVNCYSLAEDSYALPEDHYPLVEHLPAEGFVFEIVDTGRGFSKSKYAQVFGEFKRLGVEPTTDGVGLGLAISRKLIREQGGEIWFTSSEGLGSTFAFYLPYSNQSANLETVEEGLQASSSAAA